MVDKESLLLRGLLALCALPLWAGCASTPGGPSLERHAFEHPAMGTLFRIVLYAEDPGTAERAAGRAFERIDELDACLSDYRPDSELSRLGRASDDTERPYPVPICQDLEAILLTSRSVARFTRGAFDPTVGPLVRLWRRARRQGELPDPVRLERAREAVGHQHFEVLAGGFVRFHRSGMRFDLGGIAKGFALDEAAEVLRSEGIDRALLDGGGDLLATGAPPGETGWPVRVDIGEESFALRIQNEALATSGDLYRHFELDGVRYSHLIDPRTGQALTDGVAACVLGRQADWADGMASAICVLAGTEPAACEQLADDLRLEFRYSLERDGRVHVSGTQGFAERVIGSEPFKDP